MAISTGRAKSKLSFVIAALVLAICGGLSPAQACDPALSRMLGDRMKEWVLDLETRAEAGDEQARAILYDYYTDGCFVPPDQEMAERYAPAVNPLEEEGTSPFPQRRF